jgi:hypothetical protein
MLKISEDQKEALKLFREELVTHPSTLKEDAKTVLVKRKQRMERNKNVIKVANGNLPAEANMYYYCLSCGGPAQILPENHLAKDRNKLCVLCQELKERGLLNDQFEPIYNY